jgi:tetratricopeptide (TPR) repeat protein
MIQPHRRRRILTLGATLALVLLVVASAGAQNGRKNKKKKPKSTEPAAAAQPAESATSSPLATPPAAVVAADQHLLAYETEAARKALEGTSGASDAWVATALGRILEQENNFDAAATELRRAADLDTRNPAPALFLGDAFAYADKKGQAADAYAQAETRANAILSNSAGNPEALYYLGVAQQRQKRFDQAATTLAKALDARPDDALTRFQLGATHFYRQSWQEAFDALSSALERNPGIALAYYYRGLAASKLDRKDLMYNDLDRFVKMAPNSPEAGNAKQILSAFN